MIEHLTEMESRSEECGGEKSFKENAHVCGDGSGDLPCLFWLTPLGRCSPMKLVPVITGSLWALKIKSL